MKTIFEKGSLALLGTWIGNKYGHLLPAILFLSSLMLIDYLSGMLASKKEAIEHPNSKKYGWNSKKSIIGIYKKAGYILTILVAFSTDYLIDKYLIALGIEFTGNTIFGLLITVWFIINELISILENTGRMGVKLPLFLKKVLSELHDAIEEK